MKKYRAFYISSVSNVGFQDLGVWYVGGGPLTKVPRQPTSGQYSCPSPGLYIFNKQEKGRRVTITYKHGEFIVGGEIHTV